MRSKSKADRKRAAFRAVFSAAITAFRAHSKALLVQLSHGEIDARGFAEGFLDLLTELHTQASFAGRGVGSTFSGVAVSLGEVDRLAGAWMSYEQSPYVRKFRLALESGRYDSRKSHDLDPDRAMSRVDLYAERAVGTANQAMVQMLGEDEKIYWVLGENDNHCPDCPSLEEGSPYTRATLPTVPKGDWTRCESSCECHLEVNGVEVYFNEDPYDDDDPFYDGKSDGEIWRTIHGHRVLINGHGSGGGIAKDGRSMVRAYVEHDPTRYRKAYDEGAAWAAGAASEAWSQLYRETQRQIRDGNVFRGRHYRGMGLLSGDPLVRAVREGIVRPGDEFEFSHPFGSYSESLGVAREFAEGHFEPRSGNHPRAAVVVSRAILPEEIVAGYRYQPGFSSSEKEVVALSRDKVIWRLEAMKDIDGTEHEGSEEKSQTKRPLPSIEASEDAQTQRGVGQPKWKLPSPKSGDDASSENE